jgi:RHS repeat-associated protein
MPVAMTSGGIRYYLAYDQVGSLIAVADGSGSMVKRITYDSFGNVLEDSNPGFSLPFGFAGGLFDRDTSLLRFGYRDYDPEVGRWTAKDPIGFNGGDTDLYGYVVNNPVNLSDPNGQYADIALDIAFILWDIKNLYSDPCNRGENIAALGLDVLGAIVPFATGLGAGYKASKGLKPVVIGENMRDRVIPYAKEIGADWYKPRSNNPERWLGNNERWLKTKMAEGREIIDIGIDPLRTTRSPYYEAEKHLIQSSNYHINYP